MVWLEILPTCSCLAGSGLPGSPFHPPDFNFQKAQGSMIETRGLSLRLLNIHLKHINLKVEKNEF